MPYRVLYIKLISTCYGACMEHTIKQAMERITGIRARRTKHVLKRVLKRV